MECVKEQNKKDCRCTYLSCSRRGNCCACVRYHRDKCEIPGCFFNKEFEATYDRSVANFMRMHKGR